MQEQIDEFREREESTKVMYEKILSALDGLDENVNSKLFMVFRATQWITKDSRNC